MEVVSLLIGRCGVLTPCHTHPIWLPNYHLQMIRYVDRLCFRFLLEEGQGAEMAEKLLMLVVVSVLAIGPGLSYTSAAQENSVIMRPDYEKGQQSQKTLSFVMPQGWVKDEKAAKKLGLYSVLVPSGMMLENADKVITIAFHKKDPKRPSLENLKNFVNADSQDTLAKFPEVQFAKWQPSKLDPSKINFMSLEMYGKEKGKPSPQRFLILDAGDGFFSVALTLKTRSELQVPMYEDFFNSIRLGPQD